MKSWEPTVEFKTLSPRERRAWLADQGEAAYRDKQIAAWINRKADSFQAMSDLPLELRQKLAAAWTFQTVHIVKEQVSAGDGTRKFLVELADGHRVETVFMKYRYGNSLCLSTQVGCAMACSFCASGLGGKARNLLAWEMLYQYLICQDAAGEPVSRIVLMGMGEPLDNYEETAAFLRWIHDPAGLNMSYRNMTLSTCGLIAGIGRLGDDFPAVNLAVSLHAASQEEREALMPIARSNPLPALLAACRAHSEKTGRRVTFEYALIEGVNDSFDQARKLADLLAGMLAHVNLIPLNPVAATGKRGSSSRQAEAFARILRRGGLAATVRRQLGADIEGACGQLRRNDWGK